MGELVLAMCRDGPRGHLDCTPLFFTPPQAVQWDPEFAVFTGHVNHGKCSLKPISIIIIIIIIIM